uniref:Uncharacterized protein n=1 Tax=Romanomermis culicivorax TaxID=13658 RepID=A0A915KIF1_ROMCU
MRELAAAAVERCPRGDKEDRRARAGKGKSIKFNPAAFGTGSSGLTKGAAAPVDAVENLPSSTHCSPFCDVTYE